MLYDNIAAKLTSKSLFSKDWWSTLKSFIKTTNKTCIPPIEHNGISEHDKANILNSFFGSQSLLNDQDAPLSAILPTMVKSELKTIALATDEVESVLKIVPVGKASGPNGLSNRILRELSHELSIPYGSLFNRDNNLSCLQSGFIPGNSTVNQLTYLYNVFCQALDSGKEVRAIFCDISKAFDRVWHAGLLQAAGVSGKVLAWFKSYLSDRRQRVIPGATSDWTFIQAGVPQVSILVPPLFLVYINDIVIDIGSNIRLFADDTSLYIIVDDPVAAAGCLNTDLQNITRWAATWLVSFNPNRTEAVLVFRKLIRNHPPIYMQNQQIIEVESHKHLGIHFTNGCTRHHHKNILLIKRGLGSIL